MARKPEYIPVPRIWTEFQVATRLGMSAGTFRRRRKELEGEGFPEPDALLRGYDADAVQYWLDLRSGLVTLDSSDAVDKGLERYARENSASR